MSSIAQTPTSGQVVTGVGYVENQYPEPRLSGQFDFMSIGQFQPLGSDQGSKTKYWGMPHSDMWTDLTVIDDAGRRYSVAHDVIPVDGGNSLSVGATIASLDEPGKEWQPSPCHESWKDVVEEIRGDDVILTGVTNEGYKKTVTFGAKTASWKMEGVTPTNLEGHLAAPGTQWLLPWRDAAGATQAMFYQNTIYMVSGTYCGKPVKGHMMLENVWGNVPYGQSWWVRHRAGSWAIWINEYRDGTREYGQILCGEYGATGAVIVNNRAQTLLATTDVHAELKGGDIHYKFGNGQQWIFNLEREHAFGATNARSNIMSSYGQVRRIGDDRKPSYHWAYRQINRGVVCPS